MENLEELSDRIQKHLQAITDSSGLPPGPESLVQVTANWQEKRRLFTDQVRLLGMKSLDRFSSDDPRGLLVLTYSGSLVSIGALGPGGRSFEYASIKLRADVPDLVTAEGVSLSGDLSPDSTAAFSNCPLERSSEILIMAAFDETLPADEQERRLRQAAIFLTNGFVKLNRTLTLADDAPEQFTLKSMVRYVARRNGVSQTVARRVIDDYLTLVETGVLLGERVPLGRLGRLFLRARSAQKARVSRHPSTGKEILIPARPATMVPRFSAGGDLKERSSHVPTEDREPR